VLEWVFRRCDGEGEVFETPLGLLPSIGDLDLQGLDISPDALDELLTVDKRAVRKQLPQVEEHLAKFGDELPQGIRNEFEKLKERLA
jgi:phosphoenolpyruvate carboxykinase (GTP)